MRIFHFLFACVICLVLTLSTPSDGANATEWYKGQLHCHSLWSDGDTLPELVYDWYRSKGFHFVALTDHSELQTDPDKWIEVVRNRDRFASPDQIKESRSKFGNDWVETKEEEEKTFVRLKTVTELAQKLNEAGKFLVIPGHEQNDAIPLKNTKYFGKMLHTNAINITETIPFPTNFPSIAAAATAWRNASLENSAKSGLEGFWMLNHPFWPYYTITPTVFIDVPEIEFLEYNFGGPTSPLDPRVYDQEKYWDIVNAFRILNGHKPVFQTASDDAHNYRAHNFKDGKVNPGRGWVVVRSEKLEANALIAAMKKGDFYASNGVVLKDIRFDTASKTLFVDIQPEEGVKYSVRFVGTKKGFSTETTELDVQSEDGKSKRTVLMYSDEIGATFKVAEGVSVSYKMAPEDLYVRAIVTSDKKWERTKPRANVPFGPENETAWTQPYCP